MKSKSAKKSLTRRDFFKRIAGGIAVPYLAHLPRFQTAAGTLNDLFWVKGIPDLPFYDPESGNRHIGLDSLLYLMADSGLKFYRSASGNWLAGPAGLIARDDVVLIKVNAQWKYRGATNSDLIRGLIQRILEHPDGFIGEVVIFENGQGRGSLRCDSSAAYGGDTGVHANANDESHHFLYLVNNIFRDPRVSAYLLDGIKETFIGKADHSKDGYRTHENVSYPCFTTAGGRRVELREGVWQGGGHTGKLKLINVPVLKHHDTGGSEITISLKHMYGVVSMFDGQVGFRHYGGLGETCGRMMASVCTPILNIVDAIWVSHGSITGYPAGTTFRANQLLASQDPVAADYWAAKNILYPIDGNFRHHPDFPGIESWLVQARETINDLGGLVDADKGIIVDRVTNREAEMKVRTCNAGANLESARISLSRTSLSFTASTSGARPLEKSVLVAISGTRSLAWRVEKDAGWLTCAPGSGWGSGEVSVGVNPAGLTPGQYSGHVIIRCQDAANSSPTVAVALTILESRRRNGGQARFKGR